MFLEHLKFDQLIHPVHRYCSRDNVGQFLVLRVLEISLFEWIEIL